MPSLRIIPFISITAYNNGKIQYNKMLESQKFPKKCAKNYYLINLLLLLFIKFMLRTTYVGDNNLFMHNDISLGMEHHKTVFISIYQR